MTESVLQLTKILFVHVVLVSLICETAIAQITLSESELAELNRDTNNLQEAVRLARNTESDENRFAAADTFCEKWLDTILPLLELSYGDVDDERMLDESASALVHLSHAYAGIPVSQNPLKSYESRIVNSPLLRERGSVSGSIVRTLGNLSPLEQSTIQSLMTLVSSSPRSDMPEHKLRGVLEVLIRQRSHSDDAYQFAIQHCKSADIVEVRSCIRALGVDMTEKPSREELILLRDLLVVHDESALRKLSHVWRNYAYTYELEEDDIDALVQAFYSPSGSEFSRDMLMSALTYKGLALREPIVQELLEDVVSSGEYSGDVLSTARQHLRLVERAK